LVAVHDDEHLAWMVLRGVLRRIVDVEKWTAFRSVALIVEQNPRSKGLVQSEFGDLGIEETGVALPVACYYIPKSSGEPGLEIADSSPTRVPGMHGASWSKARAASERIFERCSKVWVLD
jgi:hypothetical protein